MKTTFPAAAAALGAAALIAVGVTGCGNAQADAKPAASATPDAAHAPAKAADAARAFFAAATSDKVAQMDPASPNPGVFDDAVKHVDPTSDTTVLADTLGSLATLKVAAGKAALDLKVDDSKVTVDGDTATIPSGAATIEQDGKKAPNSDADAAALTHLVFRNGAWDVSFKAPASASASPSSTASPSPSK